MLGRFWTPLSHEALSLTIDALQRLSAAVTDQYHLEIGTTRLRFEPRR